MGWRDCYIARDSWQIVAVISALLPMSMITTPAYLSVICKADPTVFVFTLRT